MITQTLYYDINKEIFQGIMSEFWNEAVDFQPTSKGYAISMPILYPDGWQVVIHLEPFSKKQGILTDKGKTLSGLLSDGVNYESNVSESILEEKVKMFSLQRNGLELYQTVKLPLKGPDVQLFCEALVSIAYLSYRKEASARKEKILEKTIKSYFEEKHIHPVYNYRVNGNIRKDIRVDCFLEKENRMIMNWVEINDSQYLLSHMEQWGYRFNDIKKADIKMKCGMIYNPDAVVWDNTVLEIGKSVCDLFLPYYDTRKIFGKMKQLKVI